MLKKIFKIVFPILIVIGILVTLIYIGYNNKKIANNEGTITVIVNDIDNNMVSKKRISYNSGDTLFDLLNDNYTLDVNSSVYGHYILGISDASFNISTKGDTSGWIWLEIGKLKADRSYSDSINIDDYVISDATVGIDSIEIVDNMMLVLNERDNNHNTSILNYMDNNIKTNSSNTLKIVFYVIIGLIFILIILSLILTHKKTNMTVRHMCILSFMTVLLFVQEEVLSFIPNIQFTFLLIALYTSVFGLRYTYMIIFVHVILDNLVMGSLNPIVVIPMLLGYMIYSTLIYLVRKKKLFYIVLLAVIGSLLYCYMFLIANALFLDIDIYLYFISDIPFEILLVLSTILSITCLYRTLEKVLSKEWNKNIKDYIN
ncbi:MAG: hypothetical protein ACI35W_00125 [Anaeroplasmataceae bacterium]